MTTSKKRIAVLVLLLLAAGAAGAWYVIAKVGRDDHTIRVSGNIEVTEVGISFKIAGRVIKRLVDEGDMVHQGQLIAELDTQDLEAQRDLRPRREGGCPLALKEMENGSRPAGDRHGQGPSGRGAGRPGPRPGRLGRAKALLPTNAMAKKDYDQAKAANDMAEEKYNEAVKQYSMVTEGPHRSRSTRPARKFHQAEAALELAKTQLSYAKVYSPLDGVVLSKNIEPGEYVAPGTPVVTVADLVNVWLRAYIDEMDLGLVKLGQRADVTVDSRPGKVYAGRVGFIASEAEFTPKTVQTEKERVKLVYRIKIDIQNPEMELKPGMPADAKILTARGVVNHAPIGQNATARRAFRAKLMPWILVKY